MDLPNRHSIRLKGYDYSQNGGYFITICTDKKKMILGNIVDEKMVLNNFGMVVGKNMESLIDRFPIQIPIYQIMPNHIHIIILIDNEFVGAGFMPAQFKRATTRVAPTLGTIIGAFKSLTTHEYINGVNQKGWRLFETRLWQRNYWEHIIRGEKDLNLIWEYVVNNPLMWERDGNNPEAKGDLIPF